ncbi:hypothetical protein DL93DRAFT_1095607 [Clavulina sp. PMI_390]|nr:hypothetical protein DL93DRAFT_1095607 [Clavulina sp. PMI_390]
MDHLPVELISHIFIFGCDFAGFYGFIASGFHSPLLNDPLKGIEESDPTWDRFRVTITSVSKMWRRIAYSTAELWSIISIRLMKSQLDTPSSFLNACLENSKTRPLDIALYGIDCNQIMAMWEMLIPALTRCRSLHLIIPVRIFQFMTPLPTDLGLLEELSLTTNPTGGHGNFRRVKILPTPSHIPRLRRLRLTEVYDRMIAAAPLENLDEFALECHGTTSPSTVVRLRNIQHLALNSHLSSTQALESIEFPNLKTLEFYDEFIVRLIRAPNLIHITTEHMRFLPMLAPDTFPRLREVEIRDSRVHAWGADFQNLSHHQFMPSVEIFRLPRQNLAAFRISVSMLLDLGMNESTLQEDPNGLFPSLRTLYCTSISVDPGSSSEFRDLDDALSRTVHEYLNGLLIKLLQQRPMLSVVVPDGVMTPALMDTLAPELGSRVINSNAVSEAALMAAQSRF